MAIASFDLSDTSIAQVEVVPLDSASQYYTRLLEFAPQSHDVHNHLGIASRATGRYEKAIEHYSAAIGLKPGESVYHHNRGLVWHVDNRDFDKALADYDEALSLSPSSAEFHVSRGILRQEQAIAIAPPAWRADFESRLKLYEEDQKYRDFPRTPAATDVISATTHPLVK